MKLATICARGGSKGVPGKNRLIFRGVDLITHTIRTARDAGVFDVVAVSSDSDELLGLAQRAGADACIRRPDSISDGRASKLDAIVHAVDHVESSFGKQCSVVVDLDVTAPLRTSQDVRAALDLLDPPRVNRVFTASPSRRSPYFNLVEVDDEGIPRIPCGGGGVVRRQDTPATMDLSGAVYVWTRDALRRPSPLIQPDARLLVLPAARLWDIDDPSDVAIVNALDKFEETPSLP